MWLVLENFHTQKIKPYVIMKKSHLKIGCRKIKVVNVVLMKHTTMENKNPSVENLTRNVTKII